MIFAIPTDTCYWLACHIHDKPSFEKIYELKKRPIEKHLSIAVKNFSELERNFDLNETQISFLKSYKYPFTVLTKFKDIDFLPQFLDREMYNEFWVRVAECFLAQKLLDIINFPIFLTSANISWEDELYNKEDIIVLFWDKLDCIYWDSSWMWKPSNIFRFKGDTCDIEFIRKNH